MSFFTVNELPGTEMLPGVVRRAVYLEHAMMTFFDFAPGSVIPEHDHPHEQITYVLQGTMEFRLGDERRGSVDSAFAGNRAGRKFALCRAVDGRASQRSLRGRRQREEDTPS